MTTDLEQQQTDPAQLYDERYERYGKPLEATHRGRYVAIFPDGHTILGDTLREVALAAERQVGPGAFVYQVGKRAVGKWR
jgi:hypothetical protein